MEKLIELLNEFEENRPMELPRQYRRKAMPTFKGGLVAISEYDDEMEDNSDLLAISKFNGFIKWLVENDKIDFRKADADISKDIVLGREPDFADFMVFRRFADDEKVIMLLSISDTPIEDLISYLK